MRLFVKQETRELFKAAFSIVVDQEVIGRVLLSGSLWSPESRVSIDINGRSILLRRKRSVIRKGLDAYRPYLIEENDHEIGEVFQATNKNVSHNTYGYQYASINSAEYRMFPIGFGEEGSKNPIYIDDTQVALVSRPAVIIDDMYEFAVIVSSEQYVETAIIFIAYIYATAFFKPGTLKKGWVKTVSVTTEKELLSKYSDLFVEKYG